MSVEQAGEGNKVNNDLVGEQMEFVKVEIVKR